MIKDIQEVNFPSYATLNNAVVSLQDMGEKTITATIKIDGDIVPDFSTPWEVRFRGESFIMPLREPQGSKTNTSLNSTFELTFYHKAIYELKRYFFCTMQPLDSGTAVADKYLASVSLNLKDFVTLFNQVLNYYYNGTITAELNPEWAYAIEPTNIEISNSYIWDVLQKLYDLYAVRWQIDTVEDKYIIRIGYNTLNSSHIFKYGFEGGLLSIERSIQDDNIRNRIIGRGGSKNLPYRYFKRKDESQPSFQADPDWIPELQNIYFAELRGSAFRQYVQGWKTNSRRQLTDKDGNAILDDDGNPLKVEPYSQAGKGVPYLLGHIATKFNPIEYVDNQSSIDKYGVLFGGLENNEEIYPTIQGVEIDGIGRVDEVVDVEQVTNDDVYSTVRYDSVVSYFNEKIATTQSINGNTTSTIKVKTQPFTVPEGTTIDIIPEQKHITAYDTNGKKIDTSGCIVSENINGKVISQVTHEEYGLMAIGAGTYVAEFSVSVENTDKYQITINLEIAPVRMISTNKVIERWGNTFDIWVKNIWQTAKQDGETDDEYARRVWGPILGDRDGNEAKVVFSSGNLSTSEDYEFTIQKGGVHYDTSKTIHAKDEQGNTLAQTYQSEWRITLGKSDADFDSIGLYVPSTKRNGQAGDYFFFTGIDLPHQYVLWAEKRLDDYKTDELNKICEVAPTWSIKLDKIRLTQRNVPITDEKQRIALEQLGVLKKEDTGDFLLETSGLIRLIDLLYPGNVINLADQRFIGTTAQEFYINTLTFTYAEPSSDNPGLIPDVEMTISDSFVSTTSTVATIQSEVDAIQKQIGSISNIEQIVRRIGDKLYLRKDGIEDISQSPTQFVSKLTSDDFQQGFIGGNGWGIYRDDDNNTVFEMDKIIARQTLEVSNFVINQISVQGGKIIESAAAMEISNVIIDQDGNYECHFDQRKGSVANLFVEGDIAMCERFMPNLTQLKFYKRKVLSIGADYVVLSTHTSEVNGSGIPEVGDVICQFGNYTNTSRQYAIVRDVIGGGYERFLEGLNSVNSNGTEYYFVGRQIGSYNNKARWFIGNEDSFAKFEDGKLTIKGDLSVESKIGGVGIEDYGINYAIGTFEPYNKLDSELSNTNNVYLIRGLKGGVSVTVSFDCECTLNFVVSELINGYAQLKFNTAYGGLLISDKITTSGHYSKTLTLPSSITETTEGVIQLTARNFAIQTFGNHGYIKISNLKVELGGNETKWTFSPNDPAVLQARVSSLDYLKNAMREDTTITNGIIQSAIIRLGYHENQKDSEGNTQKVFIPQSGVNGIPQTNALGKGLAFWGGGDCVDRALDAVNGALFGVRMDGTAYASGNVIRFEQDHILVGDSMRLSKDKMEILDENGLASVMITNKTVPESVSDSGQTQVSQTYTGSQSYHCYYNNNGTELFYDNGSIISGNFASNTFPRNVSIWLNQLSIRFGNPIPSELAIKTFILFELFGKDDVLLYKKTLNFRYPGASTTDYIVLAEDGATKINLYNLDLPSNTPIRFQLSLLPVTPTYAFDNSQEAIIQAKMSIIGRNLYENNTLIGTDGILSMQNNGYLLKNNNSFTTIFNPYGLKVDNTGIYRTKDGGKTWTEL